MGTGDSGKSPIFNLKVLGMIAVMLCLGVLGWTRLSPYYRGLKSERGQAESMDGPPSRDQMREQGRRMMSEIGLNEDQQRQVREIMTDQNLSREDRFAKLESITTPEQQQKFRQAMSSRMTNRMNQMKQKMGPEAQKQLDRRMEQRMRSGPRGGGGNRNPR